MTRVQYQRGDIFTSVAQVVVNTVNCRGIMGKGLALEFKRRYPDMFSVYQQECRTGRLRIGHPTLYKASTPWILNFPTKDHWKAHSKIEYLEKGLQYVVDNYKKAEIKSIAFPKLGTQNGKLLWDEVGPLMVKYLSKLDIDVYIYINEGDREFFIDECAETCAWQQFNELASSVERLRNEVHLSVRDAKKVFNVRASQEFSSQSNIDAIGLASTSLKKIKSYIHSQLYSSSELPGMANTGESKTASAERKRGSAKKRISKKRQKEAEFVNATQLLSM